MENIEGKGSNEEELVAFVLRKLRLGFSNEEIAKAEETGSLTATRVRRIREMLMDEGRISHGEISEARKKHNEEKKGKKYKEIDEKIKELMEQNIKATEIAKALGLPYSTVHARISRLREGGEIPEAKPREGANNIGRRKRELSNEELITKYEETKKNIYNYLKGGDNEETGVTEEHRENALYNTFISISKEIFKRGLFPKEDSLFLQSAIELKSLTEENVNFMARVFIKSEQYQEAIRFLNGICHLIENPNKEESELIEKSKEAAQLIKMRLRSKIAQEKVKKGVPITKACKMAGISETLFILITQGRFYPGENPIIPDNLFAGNGNSR